MKIEKYLARASGGTSVIFDRLTAISGELDTPRCPWAVPLFYDYLNDPDDRLLHLVDEIDCDGIPSARLDGATIVTQFGKLPVAVRVFEWRKGKTVDIHWTVHFSRLTRELRISDIFPEARGSIGATLFVLKHADLYVSSLDFERLRTASPAADNLGPQQASLSRRQMSLLGGHVDREVGKAVDTGADAGTTSEAAERAALTLRRGINFRGVAALSFGDDLASLLQHIRTIGNVKEDGGFLDRLLKAASALTQERQVSGVIDYRGQSLNGLFRTPVNLSWQPLSQLPAFTLRITSLGVMVDGLTNANAKPRIGLWLAGTCELGDGALAFELTLSPGATLFRFSAEVISSPKNGWLTAFGIDVGSEFISQSAIPTLRRIALDIPLSVSAQQPASLELRLAWDEWRFGGNANNTDPSVRIVAPELDVLWRFNAPGSQFNCSGRLWIKDNGAFEFAGSLPSGYFAASLVQDTPIDLHKAFGGMLAPLLGDASDLQIVLLDLEGNLSQKTFSFEVATSGSLVFPLGATQVAIWDIDASLSYDNGAWDGNLSASIGVGTTVVTLGILLETNQCTFTCLVPEANIADLVEDLLGETVPETLGDLRLLAFGIDFSVGAENAFKVESSAEGEILIGNVAVAPHHIEIGYGGGKGLHLSGAATVRFLSLSSAAARSEIHLSLSYEAGVGTFSGTAHDVTFALRDVVGAALPDAFADIVLTHLDIDINVGKSTAFRIETKTRGSVTVGRFEITFDRLEISYGKALGIKGDATLRVAGAATSGRPLEIALSFAYLDGTASFVGVASGLHFRLADLVTTLSHGLGFSQTIKGDAALDRLTVQFDCHAQRQRFALACDIVGGDAKPATNSQLYFVASRTHDATWTSSLAVTLPGFALHDLPLIGSPLRELTRLSDAPEASPRIADIALGLSFGTREKIVQDVLPALTFEAKMPTLDASARFSARAVLVLPNERRVIKIPKAATNTIAAAPDTDVTVPAAKPRSGTAAATAPAPSVTEAPAPASTVSEPVGRTFGPITLSRIDATVNEDGIVLAIDAAAKLGPLALTVVDLKARAPLAWPLTPRFDLRGLAISCNTEALGISGALVKIEEGRYNGALTVKFAKLSLQAFGSYGPDEKGNASIAVFTVLNQPLGGPPAFFITGLAGGAGFNRSIDIPTIDNVASHFFIAAATGATETVNVLDRIDKDIPPKAGENWFAFGVRFTSFNIVDSVALLTLSVGSDTRVNLLGRALLQFPPALGAKKATVPTLVQMELVLLADFRPATGEFKLLGQLTSRSFLFHREARLTGGFAFCIWFGNNPNAGDFVLSVGGYHPDFKVPSHYPLVPPLGINWQVSTQLSIRGQQYFAVTPAYAMMGGSLAIAWQSGSIRAWLDFQAHFLIRFQPFYFRALVFVNVGVEATIDAWLATIRVSVNVGARLTIWGPPFGGVSEVTAAGITFRIVFGAPDPGDARMIDWPTFRQTLLPPANAMERDALSTGNEAPRLFGRASTETETDGLISLAIESGLIATYDRTLAGKAQKLWLVSPGDIEIGVTTVVPFTVLNPADVKTIPASPRAGIRPMGKQADQFRSALYVSVSGPDGTCRDWQYQIRESRAPAGLWGDPRDTSLMHVPDVGSGVGAMPARDVGNRTTRRASWTPNAAQPGTWRTAWWVNADDPSQVATDDDESSALLRTVDTASVTRRRARIVEAANKLGDVDGESYLLLQRRQLTQVMSKRLQRPTDMSTFKQAFPDLLIASPTIAATRYSADVKDDEDKGQS